MCQRRCILHEAPHDRPESHLIIGVLDQVVNFRHLELDFVAEIIVHLGYSHIKAEPLEFERVALLLSDRHTFLTVWFLCRKLGAATEAQI